MRIEDTRGQARSHDPPSGLDAVEHGHAHVHQHHIGTGAKGDLHRLVTVGCLAHDLEIVLGVDEHLEPGADERFVVRDHHRGGSWGPDRLRPLGSGRLLEREPHGHTEPASLKRAGLEASAEERGTARACRSGPRRCHPSKARR